MLEHRRFFMNHPLQYTKNLILAWHPRSIISLALHKQWDTLNDTEVYAYTMLTATTTEKSYDHSIFCIKTQNYHEITNRSGFLPDCIKTYFIDFNMTVSIHVFKFLSSIINNRRTNLINEQILMFRARQRRVVFCRFLVDPRLWTRSTI